jgi:uncharacterized phiE125 gp8 family phage protein
MVDASQNSYGRVTPKIGYNWPYHRGFASFIIEFKVGYGNAASDVPDGLKQALLQLVAHFYTERETAFVNYLSTRNIPVAMRALFWGFKILRI